MFVLCQGALLVASDVKSDLSFKICVPNYLHVPVDIAWKGPFSNIWGHYSSQAASEVKCDLRFEITII